MYNTACIFSKWKYTFKTTSALKFTCFSRNVDPEFVSSAFIQEDQKYNPTGEDDKIYFFFTEVAKEYDLYTKVKVPRVARVCKVGAIICCIFFSYIQFLL